LRKARISRASSSGFSAEGRCPVPLRTTLLRWGDEPFGAGNVSGGIENLLVLSHQVENGGIDAG
jgi:hypothetical protein